MRTKALVGLAALAVGLSTTVAQNVYSLNVVGYVNVSLTQGKLHLLSYPFQDVNGNYDITNTVVLTPGLPATDPMDGSVIYKWLGTQWDPTAYAWYAGYGWYPDTVISNGVGFFLAANGSSTLTFVGQVPQGALQYTIPAGLSTLANQVPVSTNFPGAAVGNDGDTIYVWNNVGFAWSPYAWAYYAGYGWDNGSNPGDSVNGPQLDPGTGIFYANNGSAINFTQNFTVQ